MPVDESATRLMVFLSEDDRQHHRWLHEILLNQARESGIVGATVWRGIEGFGPSGRVRTSRFPDANVGLPIAVELIDSAERIENFLAVVHELAPGSFVTSEQVHVIRGHSPIDATSPP
jgi:PII-like signaling protein